MLRSGSSPIQLSQINLAPSIQSGAMAQQAIVNANRQVQSSINQAVSGFLKKQEEDQLKKEKTQQAEDIAPLLIEQSGLQIEKGTPEYTQLVSFLTKDPDKVLSKIDDFKNIVQETVTPKLETIIGPGGEKLFTYGGEIVDPNKITFAGQLGATPGGFEPEFPISYLLPGKDGAPAVRVQVTTVSKDPEGATYEDGTLIKAGDQVYIDPTTKATKKLDPLIMFPFSASGQQNIETRLTNLKEEYDTALKDIPKFQQYIDTRGNMSDSGAQRLIDNFSAAFNSFTGKELTLTQRAQQLGKAQFRQLLGSLRLDILGPGVLTEFDRKVLEEAIGGFGPGTTNEMAIEIVKGVIEKRINRAKSVAKEYNDTLQKSTTGTQYYFNPLDENVFDLAPIFDANRDLANDFKTLEEAENFAKENNSKVFTFGGDPYTVE